MRVLDLVEALIEDEVMADETMKDGVVIGLSVHKSEFICLI